MATAYIKGFNWLYSTTPTEAWTIAFNQNTSVQNVYTFLFVGLEVITGALIAGLLVFLGVEKTLKRKQSQIRVRQKAECEAKGEVWVEPEVRAAEEQNLFDEESARIYAEELKTKCEKKGLNYDAELSKYIASVEAKKAKAEANRLKVEQKEKTAVEKIEKRKADKLAKLSPEKLALREAKERDRMRRDEIKWKLEEEKGNVYRAQFQSELEHLSMKN